AGAVDLVAEQRVTGLGADLLHRLAVLPDQVGGVVEHVVDGGALGVGRVDPLQRAIGDHPEVLADVVGALRGAGPDVVGRPGGADTRGRPACPGRAVRSASATNGRSGHATCKAPWGGTRG